MENQNSEKKTWWSTLPGMITAFAGIITAITGLLVVLNQIGVFNKTGRTNKVETTSQNQTAKLNDTSSTSDQNNSGVTGIKNISITPSMNVIKVTPEVEYKILETLVEPKDPGNSFLKLKVRCTNDGKYDLNFWDASFRLSVDSLPTAPISNLDDVVAGHSVKDGIIEFQFSDNAKTLELLILTNNNKINIPLSVAKK